MKLNYIITAALICIVTATSSAQEDKQDKWIPLFNGKDLQGWKQLNGKAPFEVKDGEIIGTTIEGESQNSFLCTEKTYQDFFLELEVYSEGNLNSGIQLRSESSPDYQNGRVHGYQMEIAPPLGKSAGSSSGGIYEEGGRGWIYSIRYNPEGRTSFKAEEWNKYRIECVGNTIRTWINGVPTSHIVDATTASGFIALQVHAVNAGVFPGRKVRFRNIMIKTQGLKTSPLDDIFVYNSIPNYLSPQEKKNGYKLLWDGKTSKGWRGVHKDKFPDKGWEINKGLLSVIGNKDPGSVSGADIVTDKEYTAFELKFDFRLNKGTNSGVKYFFSESDNNNGSVNGLEFQLLDDAHYPDSVLGKNGNRSLASLFDLIRADKKQFQKIEIKKIGDWNQALIRAYPDGRVEHWLNGYKMLEYVRGSAKFLSLVKGSIYKDVPNYGQAKKGRILLQDHGDNISFRSIKIKEFN